MISYRVTKFYIYLKIWGLMGKKILFKMPEKIEEPLFFEILSKEFKIDYEIIDVLHKYFKENIYFILNIFSGKAILFPTIDELDNICLMIRIYNEISKMLREYNKSFENAIDILSEKYSISHNKVFSYYNEMLQIIRSGKYINV